MRPTMSEITVLLEQCLSGNTTAKDRLYTLLYADLKRLARAHLAKAGPITLDPSSIVHDAWLRLDGGTSTGSRKQFFAYASAVMRSVIVDHVRERAAQKRGGGVAAVTLSTAAFEELPHQADAVAIDEALQALGRVDERGHKLVEMRYFGGMTMEEVSEVMELSVPTLKRDWRRARAFLYDYLSA
jgi:RNA polymerase sigma factor (TIGR02999 family)